MFGVDPDPMVTNPWVGFRTNFGRTREDGHGMTREVRLELAVGTGLCRRPQAEKREERRPDDCFRRPKTSDVRPTILPL